MSDTVSSIAEKAIRGTYWSLVDRFGNQIALFFIGLVLARLLSPTDFGLVGMLMVFVAISQSLIDSGFSSALIRKQNAEDIDYTTVFWFNICISCILYAVIYATSPYIADFYRQPKLELITKVIGLNIVINAFGNVQRTMLIKKMDFKSQAKITIVSIFVGGAIGVAAAGYQIGVWALVAQTLSRAILTNFLLWFRSNWRPSINFSFSSFKEMFRFGSKLMLSGIIYTISDNISTIVIGKVYSPESLGFYSRANQFQKLPVTSIYGAVNVVSYPVLAELQADTFKLRSTYQKLVTTVAFFLFPVMLLLGFMAKPLIEIVLTEKWLPSAPMLQILCVVGAFYPLHAINLNILKVKGRSDMFLRLEVIKQALNILVVFICYRGGIFMLLWGFVGLNIICFFINAHFSYRLVKYGIWQQLRDLLPILTSLSVTLGFLYFIDQFVVRSALELFLLPLLGLLVYGFCSYWLNRGQWLNAQKIISKIIKR
jgi:teichuronic acid exporter